MNTRMPRSPGKCHSTSKNQPACSFLNLSLVTPSLAQNPALAPPPHSKYRRLSSPQPASPRQTGLDCSLPSPPHSSYPATLAPSVLPTRPANSCLSGFALAVLLARDGVRPQAFSRLCRLSSNVTSSGRPPQTTLCKSAPVPFSSLGPFFFL